MSPLMKNKTKNAVCKEFKVSHKKAGQIINGSMEIIVMMYRELVFKHLYTVPQSVQSHL